MRMARKQLIINVKLIFASYAIGSDWLSYLDVLKLAAY